MIDFRYHLVSLVAVFLALAIGIVMGAGPLRESLGEQLTSQVAQLRADRDAMRGENERVQAENADLAEYINATGNDLVSGTLDGRSVVIVTDHESMQQTASGVQGLVRSGGGAVTNIVTLNPSLWDPNKEGERKEAVEHIHKAWPAAVVDGDTTSAQLTGTIARITARKFDLTENTRTEIAVYLRDSGFIQTTRPRMSAADGLVYVGAEQKAFAVDSDNAEQASARSGQLNAASTAVIHESTQYMKATVAAGANAAPATSEGVVRTVRGSNDMKNVATVDGATRASGPSTTTLALASAYLHEAGAYGVASDATAVAPSRTHIREQLKKNETARDNQANPNGGAQ